MSNENNNNADRNVNLWAPWRMEYIDSLSDPEDNGCFLCKYSDEPQNDKKHLVVRRGQKCFAVMNRFPYTGGHMLIAPYAHVANLEDLDRDTMCELMEMTRDIQKILQAAICPQGFNIGINIGRCSGAGLPEHIHLHIVPRWSGDTNFMSVLGDVRVIPQALEKIHENLLLQAEKILDSE